MRITLFTLMLAILCLVSCGSNSTEPKDTFTVEGTIFYRNHEFENAVVTLNDQSALSTTTDAAGLFKISNVPAGEHNLKISKVFEDGTSSERSETLSVSRDIVINSLILPRAVVLYEPSNTNDRSTVLEWTPTDAADFREYKIFRHSSSGLDESTGELIHISTAIHDTSFTDEGLFALTDYYYRVYVMNEYGQLGGSNIVSATTLVRNLFPDGGMELSDSSTNNWNTYTGLPSIEISDSLVFEGSHSLHLTLPSFIAHDLMSGAEADEIYELSFWYRFTGDSIAYGQPDDRSYTIDHFGGANIGFDMFRVVPNTNPGQGFDSDWLFYSENIVMKEETPVYFYMSLSSSTGLHMWLDNFSLTKVEL